MNFPGISTDVSFVQFLYGPHCHHKWDRFSLLIIFSLSCWFTLPPECLSLLEILPLCVQRMSLFYRFKSKIGFLYNRHRKCEKSHRFILQQNVLFQVPLKLSVTWYPRYIYASLSQKQIVSRCLSFVNTSKV